MSNERSGFSDQAENKAGMRTRVEQRNGGIDLLRGISIVLVILNHVGLRIRLTRGVLSTFIPAWLLDALNFNGGEAVLIFFVISGFLIATNSIKRWGRLGAIDPRAFYLRRASRIVPCLVALVAVLALLHLLRVPGYVIDRPNESLGGAVGSAFGLYLNWYEANKGYLPASWDVLWSLSIEEVFYLAFPLVCLTVRKDAILAPLVGVFALSLPALHAGLHGIWREKAYLPGMAGIATGVLGALIAARWIPRSRGILLAILIAGACGVLAILGFEMQLWPFLGESEFLLLTGGTLCLLLAFHWQARSGAGWKIPGAQWLQSFGRLSYEIYLTHMFVVLTLVRIYRSAGSPVWWGLLWYLPALACAWALGWLLAKYLSMPVERWMRGAMH